MSTSNSILKLLNVSTTKVFISKVLENTVADAYMESTDLTMNATSMPSHFICCISMEMLYTYVNKQMSL